MFVAVSRKAWWTTARSAVALVGFVVLLAFSAGSASAGTLLNSTTCTSVNGNLVGGSCQIGWSGVALPQGYARFGEQSSAGWYASHAAGAWTGGAVAQGPRTSARFAYSPVIYVPGVIYGLGSEFSSNTATRHYNIQVYAGTY